MNSYIFQSRPKNIIAIVFTALYALSLLSSFYGNAVIYGYDFLNYQALGILVPIAILIYLLTLKKQYKFKKHLFPLAFGILMLLQIISFIDTVLNIDAFLYSLKNLSMAVLNQFLMISLIFCFVGTLLNFKNAVFLRIGTLMYIIFAVILCVLDTLSYISEYYIHSFVPDDIPFVNVDALIKLIIVFLFHLGIFILTLNKKGEYPEIQQIAPIEKPKTAEKPQEEEEEMEIPEGCWKCMGCGKMLPDEMSECECGYKKKYSL